MNNCISKDDIVMLNNVMVGPYQNGIVNKPLVVFGKNCLGFEENGEFLNVIINTEVDAESQIGKINEILDRVSDCRSELEEFYFENLSDMVSAENQSEVMKSWYDTLEVFSGLIEIPKNGEISLEFMCGDCILKDEVFYLKYTMSEGFSIWFDD